MLRNRGRRVWVWAAAGAFAWVLGCGVGGGASQDVAVGTELQPTGGTTPGVDTGTGTGAAGTGLAATSGGNRAQGTGAVNQANVLVPANNANTGVAAQANTAVDLRYPYAFVGRFDLRNPNQARFNFPGSKIGVAFTGTSLGISITDTGTDTFGVTIDGVDYATTGDAFASQPAAPTACRPVAQVPAFDGNNYPGCILAVPSSNANMPTTYPVATGLADGNHVAWITKRSEFLQGSPSAGYCGTTTLWGFVLDAGAKLLPPPPTLRRRIEVVGDSSTSGFGAGQRGPCTYSPRNCDAGRGLPSFLSQYLHAEHVNASSSGQGVYRSYYDHNLGHNLPVVWRQTVGLDASYPWDFSDRVDVVLLSAGGDDLWGAAGSGAFNNNAGSSAGDARDNFVAAYLEWLGAIRRVRPEATIVVSLTYGAMGNDIVTLGGALQDAVRARNNAGDANVVYYTYFPANDSARNPNRYTWLGDAIEKKDLWYGCKGHPSPKSARYLAGLLGPFIAQRMGWQDVGP